MKKLLLIPVLALFTCVNMWGETVQVSSASELATAISNASADVIQLTADIDDATTYTITRSLTLDLQNHTITQPEANKSQRVFLLYAAGIEVTIQNGTITRESPTYVYNGQTKDGYLIYGYSYSQLTLTNMTLSNAVWGIIAYSGNNVLNNTAITVNNVGIYASNGARVQFNSGTITVTDENNNPRGITLDEGTSLNIVNGKIHMTGLYGYGVSIFAGSRLVMTGGEIIAQNQAIAGNGSQSANTYISITGGLVEQQAEYNDYGIGIYHPQGGELRIGGNAVIKGATGVQFCAGTGIIDVKGGTIMGLGSDLRPLAGSITNGAISDGAALSIMERAYPGGAPTINITSGTFTSAQNSAVMTYARRKIDNVYTSIDWTAANTADASSTNAWDKVSITGGYFSQNPALSTKVTMDAVDYSCVPAGYTVDQIEMNSINYYMVHKGNVTSAQDFIDTTGDEVVKLTKEDESDPSLEVVVGDNVGTETEQVAEYVEVAEDVTLIVKDNATLTVGDGGMVLADENSKMEVEAGGTVIVGANGIVSTDESNIVLNASEEKHSTLLLDPNVTLNTTPKATYRFTSKAFADGETWVYQRFGMPTYDGNVTVKVVDNSFNGDSWLAKWNYETDQWGAWNALTSSEYVVTGAQPFQGYLLASNNARNTQMVYEFTGNLMGNTDANLHFYYGWNFYANSYTAPISIVDFVETVKQSLNSNDILATIYLYKDLGNDTYTWQAVNQGNAGDLVTVGFELGVGPIYEQLPSNIKPMQAFMMKLNKQGEAYQEIDYANNVYGPAINSGASLAPARNRQANNKMQVSVYNAEGFDKVFFIENDQFSDALDNGYDAYKCDQNKGVQLYAMNNSEHMEIMATDNIEGTFIGIDAPKAGNYTLHFSGINGMEYAIVDMENNTTINIAEGAEYTFSAAKGQNDYRFQIVEAAKMPTAIDNTEVKSAIKGIYTITGQYLGEDFNRVPAGIYIVNGVKVVK